MGTWHKVVQGECMQSIAARYGFSTADMIWLDSKNDDLRKRRSSKYVLAPGDMVYIPAPRKKVMPCATGKAHRFKVRLPRRNVHVVLTDGSGQPIANSSYLLQVGSERRSGKTDSNGAVHEKGFPPHIDRGELRLPELGIKRTLLIGHLDPHHEDSGWRQRLINLGYRGDEDGLAQFASDQQLARDTDAETIRNALHKCSRS